MRGIFESMGPEFPTGESPNIDGMPKESLWRSMRRLWCSHSRTIVTPRTDLMPPHVVCQLCGWREPAPTTPPQGVRTWDSSRDEARYARDKRRRAALELQRQEAVARLAVPPPEVVKPRRGRKDNIVVQMKRA